MVPRNAGHHQQRDAAAAALPTTVAKRSPAENISGLTDNFGDRDPWIEIYNAGMVPLSLDGVYLANNYTPGAMAFPTARSLAPANICWFGPMAKRTKRAGADWHTSFRSIRRPVRSPCRGWPAVSPQILDYFNYNNVAADRSFGAFPPGQASYRQTFNYATPRRNQRSQHAGGHPVSSTNGWLPTRSFLPIPPTTFRRLVRTLQSNNYAVDLGGYNLTTTFTNLTKFTIPPGVTIAARLLIGLGRRRRRTRLDQRGLARHFRLGQGGESIGLYAPDGRLVDAITFGPQTNNVSERPLAGWKRRSFLLHAHADAPHTQCVPMLVDDCRAALEPGNVLL